MDKFFYNFLDTLPVFICVADEETKLPVYYNKLAAECLENMSEPDRVDFVKDAISLESLLKYCENTNNSERGYWFNLENTMCEWIDGKQRILISGADYSKSITNEELLTVANFTDGLTGIYNRKIGLEMLAKFVNELEIGAPPFTMCFVDLNDLKYVNDKRGHQAGDQYLITVADIIKGSIRQSDVFARLGGDEFLVIFPKCTYDVAAKIFEEVSKLLDAVNNENQPRTYYSISYGVLEVGPSDGLNMEALLAEAGAIMYKMKSEYKAIRTLPN